MSAGEIDTLVPPEQSHESCLALKLRGVKTRLSLYPREPHGISEPSRRVHYFKEILDWIEERVRAVAHVECGDLSPLWIPLLLDACSLHSQSGARAPHSTGLAARPANHQGRTSVLSMYDQVSLHLTDPNGPGKDCRVRSPFLCRPSPGERPR